MRKDHYGKPCPATLSEYVAWCKENGATEDSKAIDYLKKKIAETKGGDAVVSMPDPQMKSILYPLLMEKM